MDKEGQRLPFEPMDHRGLLGSDGVPTIGGVVATNASGPRRIQVGAVRDFMLGVRFVDGMGTVVKNGGRVMKNVTGYDLVKLMTGSYGTLGVMTEVALKVLPKPDVCGVVCVDGLGIDAAVGAMSAALGSPYDVSGAAYVPAGGAAGKVIVRVEGFETSVAYRMQQLSERLAEFGDVSTDTDADRVAQMWADVRDVAALRGKVGDIWRVSVKPSDAPALIAAVQPEDFVLDWGGGLVWLHMTKRTDLRAKMGEVKGHATRILGEGTTAVFQPEPKALADISAGLRAKFDPRGILNPGLMG